MNPFEGKPLIAIFSLISLIGMIVLGFYYFPKLEVILYKIVLVCTAGTLAFLFDIGFFPRQKPGDLIKQIDGKGSDEIQDPQERANMYLLISSINIRRAIIVGCFLIAFMTGL